MMLCSLCIGLFQQSAPEFVFPERFGENQLVVARGEAVIYKHVSPFAVPPELRSKEQKTIIASPDLTRWLTLLYTFGSMSND